MDSCGCGCGCGSSKSKKDEYKCADCGKTSEKPDKCCGKPMKKIKK